MRIIQILNLLLLTALLSGCWTLSGKGEAPASLGNTELLESFIGQKSENVIRELGVPNELLVVGDKKFMMYSAQATGTGVLMIGWIPVWAERDAANILHCLRIELDSANLAKDYQVKSKAKDMLVLFNDVELNSNCREVFWNKKELANLQDTVDTPSTWIPSAWKEAISQVGIEGLAKEKAERLAIEEAFKRKDISHWRNSLSKYMTTSELKQQSMVGNPYAQFRLYRELMQSEPTTAYRWLCKSADNGHSQARYTLGQISKYSKQDHVQAYVWYALSSYSQSGNFNEESLQAFVENNLSAKEYQKARIALLKWRPGQCVAELGLEQR